MKLGTILTWLGWVIGLAAGVQQLWSWLDGRGLRRAQKRAFDILDQQLDAERALEDKVKYEEQRSKLKREVDVEIPREARRIFLANRAEQLENAISQQYGEYQAVTGELATLGVATAPLDARIADVVRRAISLGKRPLSAIEKVLLIIACAIFVTNVAPFTLSYLASVGNAPAGRSGLTLAWAIAVCCTLWACILSVIATQLRIWQNYPAKLRKNIRRPSAFFAIIALISSAFTIGGTCNLWSETRAAMEYREYSYGGAGYLSWMWLLQIGPFLFGVAASVIAGTVWGSAGGAKISA